jgi:hypothetical protein
MGAASRRRAAADFDQRFVVDRVLAAYAEAAEARGLHLVPDPRD